MDVMSEQGVPVPPPWEKQDPTLPYPGYFEGTPHGWLRYHGYHKRLARAFAAETGVVFLGDSITQGWDESLWFEHFDPEGALNFGIGGDKTCQVLWRIGDGLLDGLAPRLVVLAIGVNSIWSAAFTGERIAEGIGACVGAIREKCPGARVLISGVLPSQPSPSHPYHAIIADINAHAARLADGGAVRFLDIGSALLETDGTLTPAVAPDGTHLSYEGYRRLADAILPTFQEMVQR